MNGNTGGRFGNIFSAATKIERHELKATLLSDILSRFEAQLRQVERDDARPGPAPAHGQRRMRRAAADIEHQQAGLLGLRARHDLASIARA